MPSLFRSVKSNDDPAGKGLLLKCYQQLIDEGHIQKDLQQIQIIHRLQQLIADILEQIEWNKQSAVVRWVSADRKAVKGVYIFGDVGRGKSMLMDLFFDTCPIKSKRRVHFHAFMQEIHDYMHQWRSMNEGDPLPALAEKITASERLLCFDEFHVTDIADAMLLARLFTRLFEQGVIVVATSNQHPDDLYKNGLQRELFLPFIALLKKSSDLVELAAKEDYRLLHIKSMKTTFYCEVSGGHEFLQQSFNELSNGGKIETKVLKFKGRRIVFTTVHSDILMTSFDALCGKELAAIDFLAISQEFSTILLADIPRFSADIRDQVRRFVTLIDMVYEHNVTLIFTASLPIEQFYFEDPDFDFKRTRSRLFEMQSEKYFQNQHLA